MKPTDDRAEPRRPYYKPHLRRFSLVADEVLAKGCKLSTGGASFQGPGCFPGGCVQGGS